MTAPQPCLGGWCSKRAGCQHYTSKARAEPAERLCETGRDGVLRGAPAHSVEFHATAARLAEEQAQQWAAGFVSMGKPG